MKSLKLLPLLILILTVLTFFYPLIIQNKIPIPADTIVGLYHPFRDYYSPEYPNGIPFKNSLVTDPVRQQFPWKFYSILLLKYQTFPLWNPYNMAGTPLYANLQSSPLYPLNIILFMPDFNKWWGIFILIQPMLAGIFMYLYLKNLKLNDLAAYLGGIIYAFSGFSVAWMEWGNIGHVALWCPLILLSVDKLFGNHRISKLVNLKISNLKVKLNYYYIWYLVYLISLTSSFLAGHVQTFYYLYLITLFYFLARWIQNKKQFNQLLKFIILNFCFLIIISIQWFPAMQFILQSARDVDQINYQKEGWFLPVQNLIQFFAPDFFGNPATLNYWGIWNYGEFIGYVGIFPLIISLYALFFRYDKKTLFFGSVFFVSLIFALPTFFAKIIYEFQIPFLSTAQPTRLLFLTCLSLSVLASLGLDFYLKTKNRRNIIPPLLFVILIYMLLWVFIYFSPQLLPILSLENLNIAKRNLYVPTIFTALISITILISFILKSKKLQYIFIIILLVISVIDLFRFFNKFTPFTDEKYLYPDTVSLYIARKYSGFSRIMSTDARILPPNFSIMYFIQSLDGYDPLYLRRYGELIAAMERNAPDIKPPFGFNRIINPHNYNSKIADLLGVKYIFSLTDLDSPKLQKTFTEGQTRIYENLNSYDRVFYVENVYPSSGKNESIKVIFDKNTDLKKTAIVENWDQNKTKFSNKNSKAEIDIYKSNEIIIKTDNNEEAFLVLTDSYYPNWHANICDTDRQNCIETKIYLTDYNFRGIVIPPGRHTVVFNISII